MRMRTNIGFVLIAISYAATITAILGACGAPFRKNWQINPDPGSTLLTAMAMGVQLTRISQTLASLPSLNMICSLPLS